MKQVNISHARRNSEGRATPQSQTTNLFWKKPQAQFFKFNVDATLFKDQNRFGVGICLRGDEENFIKAKTFFNNGIPNPRTTKTWELLQAMGSLPQRGWSERSFENSREGHGETSRF